MRSIDFVINIKSLWSLGLQLVLRGKLRSLILDMRLALVTIVCFQMMALTLKCVAQKMVYLRQWWGG